MNKKPTAIISFGILLGGMEMDAFRLAGLLCKHMDVTLIAKSGSLLVSEYRKACEASGIRLETIDFRTFFSPSVITGVRRIVRDNNIKNVIFFGASEMRSLYFSFLGLDINLIIRHGMKKTSPKKDLLHRLVYSNVNWHVSICEYLYENVKEIIPFGKRSRDKIIYSALRHLPSVEKEPLVRIHKPVKLLHVARIAPGKGQDDAISACGVLHKKNIPFELHLVGEIFPPYARQFENLLNGIEYRKSIVLHGFSRNIPDFLNEADIFIYPSGGEGLSNSFIEALAYGLACVSYDNTSFPELRRLGFNMHIARTGDIEDLTRKLMDAIDYISANPTPITHNIDLAARLFSSERELNEYMEILV